MSLNSRASGHNCLRFWISALLLLLLLTPASEVAGQTAPSPAAKNLAIESHFSAAQQAQHDKDYSTAEREYRAVLALAPDFAEVHMNLGLVYQLQDRSTEAMAEFSRALKAKPGLTGANFFLGVDYCKLGDGAKAIPYLKAALQADPGRPDTWLWLATAQEISGELQGEVATLQQALELQPKDVDVFYLLGSAYERLGKQEVAHLQRAAPGSSRSEQLLAESYAASSEWPSAVIHFQNALTASPNRAGLHAEMGEVLLRAGKVNQAIRGLRETGFGDSALEQLPDSAHEKIQRLAEHLQTRNSPAAHLALAFLAQQNGNLSQARAESILAGLPYTERTVSGICTEAEVELALQREEFSKIVPCADEILTSRTSAELRIRVASALLEAGHSDAALKALEGLPATNRVAAEAAYWRARCYERLATTTYLRLYQAGPDSYRLHQLIGDLEAAKGDDAKAIEEYRAAIALKPSSPNLHYSLGQYGVAISCQGACR